MKIITPKDTIYLEKMSQCQIDMAMETENFTLNTELITAGVKEVLTNPHRGKYYLAIDEKDNLMGMLLTMPEWSDWRCAEVTWIHSVYVYPQHRGKGIYKAMYEHLKEIVNSDRKYAGLRLYVDKTNLKAIEVYEKLGMSEDHYSLYEWLK
jgi:ribosomal protein S18 acetylase RimI-like enzyme